jgi:hypothetical protein
VSTISTRILTIGDIVELDGQKMEYLGHGVFETALKPEKGCHPIFQDIKRMNEPDATESAGL